jgi:hypothetical protein
LRPWFWAILDEARERCGDLAVEAFIRYFPGDRSAASVAAELGIKPHQVFGAIPKVRSCLEQIVAGWFDDIFPE